MSKKNNKRASAYVTPRRGSWRTKNGDIKTMKEAVVPGVTVRTVGEEIQAHDSGPMEVVKGIGSVGLVQSSQTQGSPDPTPDQSAEINAALDRLLLAMDQSNERLDRMHLLVRDMIEDVHQAHTSESAAA
jgi:DNA-binding transcriptional regulator LsrR (DeoR family)